MSRAALARSHLERHALQLAPGLLGCLLSHDSPLGLVVVRITEVEAYAGEQDPGSHARSGRTARNATMFGPPGRLYVYFAYGMHWCVNIVCAPEGEASAVLLRAGEVVVGHDLARTRRPTARRDHDLARGPACLARALGLGRDHDGTDVCADGPVALRHEEPLAPAAVRTGPRVGVAGPGGDPVAHPWRFWSDGEPSVSRYRAAVPRRR